MKVSFFKTPMARPSFEIIEHDLSVEEVAAMYNCDFDKSEIYLDGVKIDPSLWSKTYCLHNSHLVIVQVPGEVSFWLAVGSLVLAAGTAIYAYTQYESPPDGPSQAERRNRLSGASNGVEKFSAVPVILGRHKVTPPYAARSYREYIGNDEYLNVMFCLGHGPMKVHEDTIKIGETNIENFDEVSYTLVDYFENTDIQGLRDTWIGDIVDLDPGVELDSDNLIPYWVDPDRAGDPTVRSTEIGPDYIELDWNWPEGAIEISNSKGEKDWGSAVEATIRRNGDTYQVVRYGGIGGYTIARGIARNSQGEFFLNTSFKSNAGKRLGSSRNPIPTQFVYSVDEENRVVIFKNLQNWAGQRGPADFCSRSAWRTTDQVRRGLKFKNPFPKNESLDIFCRQIYGQERGRSSRTHRGRIEWTGLKSIYNLSQEEFNSAIGGDKTPLRVNGDPVHNFKPVIMTMRVRATSQISGNLDNVSMEVESVVPSDWESDWRDWPNRDLKTTNNPAELFRWLLQGPMNNSPVANERIDLNSLDDWRQTCIDMGWETSYLLNEEVTLQEQLNNIGFTGRAELTSWSGRFGVIQNIEQDIPVQMFSPKNSWDFGVKREFPEQVDGIKYEFANAERDYEQDEQEYVDPFLTTSDLRGKFNGVELWGVTKPELATKHARFIHFEEKLRRFNYTLKTDIEGLIPRRGQMVTVNNDVIDVGLGSGYVTEVSENSFRIDERFGLEQGVEYGIKYRPFVGDIEQFYATYEGDGWFSNPENLDIQKEEFIFYGEPSFVGVDCIVKNVGFGDDYEATINLVNAAQEIYGIDDDEIPEFESILTPNEVFEPPLPPEVSLSPEPFNFTNNTLHVKAVAQQQSGVTVDSFLLEYLTVSDYDPREVIEEEDAIQYVAQTSNGSEVVSLSPLDVDDPDLLDADELLGEDDRVIFGNDNAKIYTVESVTGNEMTLTEPFEGEDGDDVFIVLIIDDLEEDTNWSFTGTSTTGDFFIPFSDLLGNVVKFRARAISSTRLNSTFSQEKEVTLSRQPSEAVDNLVIEERLNTPRTPDAMFSTIRLTVEEPDDDLYAFAIIEYRQQGQSNWETVGRIGSTFEDYQEQQVFSAGVTYEFRARSVSIFGVESREGPFVVVTTTNINDPGVDEPDPSDFIKVPNVKGLEIYEQGNDNEFKGRDVEFEWRKSTIEDWIEIGEEGRKGASSANLDQFFRDYQVEIWANNRRVHKEWVDEPYFIYSYEMNAEDFEREEGEVGAYRDFQIRVYERGRNNQISKKPAKLDVTNPPIEALSGLSIEAGFNVIEIAYDRPDERDFAGVDIWVSDESGITEDDDVTKTVSDNSVVVSGLEQGETYYVRLRPFDVFGRVGSPLTSEFTVTTKTGIDVTGLSGWAYQIEEADRDFIEENLANDAVPSEKIENLTAAKITAGVINATETITAEGLIRAVDDINDIRTQVGIGPAQFDGDTYLLWGERNGDLRFGVDELGNAFFKGDISASSFSNDNLTIDEQGNVESTGTFRFGGQNEDFIEFDGNSLVIDTESLKIDPSGATFSGAIEASTFENENFIINEDGTFIFGDEESGQSISFDGSSIEIGNQVTIGDNNDRVVTVGSGGDFPTLNLALESLSRVVPAYKKGGFTAEILMLEGYVLDDAVVVRGLDLSWITIKSENDAVVAVSGVSSSEDAVFNFIDTKAPVLNFVFDIQDEDSAESAIRYSSNSSGILIGGGNNFDDDYYETQDTEQKFISVQDNSNVLVSSLGMRNFMFDGPTTLSSAIDISFSSRFTLLGNMFVDRAISAVSCTGRSFFEMEGLGIISYKDVGGVLFNAETSDITLHRVQVMSGSNENPTVFFRINEGSNFKLERANTSTFPPYQFNGLVCRASRALILKTGGGEFPENFATDSDDDIAVFQGGIVSISAPNNTPRNFGSFVAKNTLDARGIIFQENINNIRTFSASNGGTYAIDKMSREDFWQKTFSVTVRDSSGNDYKISDSYNDIGSAGSRGYNIYHVDDGVDGQPTAMLQLSSQGFIVLSSGGAPSIEPYDDKFVRVKVT